jgi:hypothetical protein
MKLLVAGLLLAANTLAAQEAGVQGHVTDPSGSAVVDARIAVRSGGKTRGTTHTDSGGAYALQGLPPGTYTLAVSKDGFAPHEDATVVVAAGRMTTQDVALEVARHEESVTVQSEAPALDLAPENNAGALVIKGTDLDALPDDPDELQDALQALAGSAAGPNGGQLFIDGFSGGRLPPKSSIREIRINANPFSAEYDKLGYGRIEIFTKAGSDHFRAETQFRFNNQGLNAQNPFADNKPPYHRAEWGGNVSGPLVAKKASYFLDFEQRNVNDNAIVTATLLDPANPLAQNGLPFNQAFQTPQLRTTVSPRLDWQLSPAHTLSARYTYTSTSQDEAGVGGYSLPSRAYDTSSRQHTFQLTETAVLGKVVSETRVRFLNQHSQKSGDDSLPTLQVSDAFTSGGAQIGPSTNDQNQWELTNVTSFSLGHHSLRAGARFRSDHQDDIARSGFGGTVLFAGGTLAPIDEATGLLVPGGPEVSLTTLQRYGLTVMLQQKGFSGAQIRALGGGASQLMITGGNPAASVSQWDVAPFIQDDWRVSQSFLLSAGLRYERQDNIESHYDFAPRLSFAWSPGAKGANSQPKTILRGGFGIFYDRFDDSLTLRATRSGLEQQYLVTDPEVLDELVYGPEGTVTGLPSTDALAAFAQPRTITQISPDLRSPYTIQSSLSLERQLPHNVTATLTVIGALGRRQLRSRNLNAPLPDGTFPLGAAAGSVYQIESTGKRSDLQWILGVNNRLNPKLSVFARYFLAWAHSDTDGVDSFPADPYDLSQDWSRASNDVRHRVVLGGNVVTPGGLRFSPFLVASTGRPYNITTGQDGNDDGIFNDRPAFATNPDASSVHGYDVNPAPGTPIIPRNYGDGPSSFMLNLRLSRTFRFGAAPGTNAPPEPPRGGGGGFGGGRWGGGGGGREGGRDGGDGSKGITVSVMFQNALNHTNLAPPIGNLSSPKFGTSISAVSGFGFGPGGGGGSAAARRIELQARLSF